MTVPLETSEIAYTGNNATVAFPIPFPFEEDDDVDVMMLLDGDTVAVAQVDGVDYNLAGANADDDGTGGTCTMVDPPPNGATLTITRTVPITQVVNLRTSGPFSPAVHLGMFDKLTQICQQLNRKLAALEALGSLVPIDSFEGIVKSHTFDADVTAIEDLFPLTVVLPAGFIPTAVWVAKVEDLSDGSLFEEPVGLDWSAAALALTVRYLSGLTPGKSYRITYMMVSTPVT